jgi:hypothetical protein
MIIETIIEANVHFIYLFFIIEVFIYYFRATLIVPNTITDNKTMLKHTDGNCSTASPNPNCSKNK